MLSRRRNLILSLAIVAAVLFACRGLIFGSGTYGLYIDNGWPPDGQLLHGIATDRTHLWNSTNLGTRILYPSEYPVDEAILGALRLGVPAWIISRLVPIALLALAGIGMASFLRALGREIDEERSSSNTIVVVAAILGLGYALSPLAFTELVAGHYLYLIALALVPLIGRAWLAVERPWSLGLCAVLIAFALSQIQFAVMLPLFLLALAVSLPGRRLIRRGAAAYGLGLLPQLAWVVPLLVYRPAHLSLRDYIDPEAAYRFAINPLNGIRAVGYITPFVERTITLGHPLWELVSFALAAVAFVGLFRIKLTGRFWPLYVVVLTTAYYEWGGRAPLYRGWNFIDSTAVGVLFRERYHLTFLVLTSLVVIVFVVTTDLARRRAHVEVIALAGLVLVGLTWQFGDGHLGRYGAVRENFSVDSTLTQFFASHPQAAVVTVPAGSIIKRRNWIEFGRSPFQLGGPPWILDPEGNPTAASIPLVTRLSDLLSEPYPGVAAREYLLLLHVGYVVLRPDLRGDTPSDFAAARVNLVRGGYRRVFVTGSASVWQAPELDGPRFTVRGNLLAAAGDASGSIASSELWRAALVAPGTERSFLKLAASWPLEAPRVLHLDHRPVSFAWSGRNLRVAEPVLVREGSRWILRELRYSARLPSRQRVLRAHGRVLRSGQTTLLLDGPIDHVETGVSNESLRRVSLVPGQIRPPSRRLSEMLRPKILRLPDPSFERHLPLLQDVLKTDTRSARQVGLGERLVTNASQGAHALLVQAKAHGAGIPIRLPLMRASEYRVSVDARFISGRPATVAVIANGRRRLVGVTLARRRGWHTVTIRYDVPPDTFDLYLYLYVFGPGDGRTSATVFDNVRATVRSSPRAYLAATGEPHAVRARGESIDFRMPGPPGRDVVVWLTDARGLDAGWSLEANKGSIRRLPWPVNGYANGWTLSAPGGAAIHATAVYLPDRLFRALILPLWAATLLLAGLAALVHGRLPAREIRRRLSLDGFGKIAREGALAPWSGVKRLGAFVLQAPDEPAEDRGSRPLGTIDHLRTVQARGSRMQWRYPMRRRGSSEDHDELRKQDDELPAKLKRAEDKLAKYRERETLIAETLLTAQSTANELRERAERDVEQELADAEELRRRAAQNRAELASDVEWLQRMRTQMHESMRLLQLNTPDVLGDAAGAEATAQKPSPTDAADERTHGSDQPSAQDETE
jgi:hypothetical protein